MQHTISYHEVTWHKNTAILSAPFQIGKKTSWQYLTMTFKEETIIQINVIISFTI